MYYYISLLYNFYKDTYCAYRMCFYAKSGKLGATYTMQLVPTLQHGLQKGTKKVPYSLTTSPAKRLFSLIRIFTDPPENLCQSMH